MCVRAKVVGQRPRGHISDFFANPPPGIEYCQDGRVASDVVRGRPAMLRGTWRSTAVRSGVVNWAGLFVPVIDLRNKADIVIAINRFYVGRIPHIVWLERPAAPLHYEPSKLRNPLTRWVVRRLLEERRGLYACWSRACAAEFEAMFSFSRRLPAVIPPMVTPPSVYMEPTRVMQRQMGEKVGFLLVGSQFHLKGGKEAVLAFELLQTKTSQVELTIVTDPETIGGEWRRRIEANAGIRLRPATLGRREMWNLYDSQQVLIHPTRFDSYGLVVLEAVRIGLPVIASSIYAIPEVLRETSGILLEGDPPSGAVHIGYGRRDVDFRGSVSRATVEGLYKGMCELLNLDKRVTMGLRARERSEEVFGVTAIHRRWKDAIASVLPMADGRKGDVE